MTELETHPAASETRLCEKVFPKQANHYGTLFGGTAPSLMGKAAFIAASHHARAAVAMARRHRRSPSGLPPWLPHHMDESTLTSPPRRPAHGEHPKVTWRRVGDSYSSEIVRTGLSKAGKPLEPVCSLSSVVTGACVEVIGDACRWRVIPFGRV